MFKTEPPVSREVLLFYIIKGLINKFWLKPDG